MADVREFLGRGWAFPVGPRYRKGCSEPPELTDQDSPRNQNGYDQRSARSTNHQNAKRLWVMTVLSDKSADCLVSGPAPTVRDNAASKSATTVMRASLM